MHGLIIANPRRKSRSKSRRKVKRNPIANLGFYAKKKRSSTKRRRSRSRALSAAPAATRGAPVRRSSRRRRRSGGFVKRAGSSVTRVVGSSVGQIANALVPAAVGAAGALGVDLLWGYLPIPASFKTGPLAPVARIVGAVGVGMAAGMIGGKKFGREAMVGALTVTVTDLGKGFLKSHTSLPLSYYPGRGLGCPPRGLAYYPEPAFA
jgi:hypothetical protein